MSFELLKRSHCQAIKEVMSMSEIVFRMNLGDYSAEMLLRHIIIHAAEIEEQLKQLKKTK